MSRSRPDLPPAEQVGTDEALPQRNPPVVLRFAGFSAGSAIWAELLSPWLSDQGVAAMTPGIDIASVRIGGLAATPAAVHKLLNAQQVHIVHIEQDELCKVDCARLLEAKDLCPDPCALSLL